MSDKASNMWLSIKRMGVDLVGKKNTKIYLKYIYLKNTLFCILQIHLYIYVHDKNTLLQFYFWYTKLVQLTLIHLQQLSRKLPKAMSLWEVFPLLEGGIKQSERSLNQYHVIFGLSNIFLSITSVLCHDHRWLTDSSSVSPWFTSDPLHWLISSDYLLQS